jgi:SAM-dependent methyltransferase
MQTLLFEVADQMFSGAAQHRAFQDVPTKSRYLSELFRVANEHTFDLYTSRILDIGCSKCDTLLVLKRLGMNNLTGLNLFDYDLQWLNNNQQYEQYFGDSVNKIKYLISDVDASPLPFEGSSFEVVLLFDVLEHLHDPKRVISECKRVLSSGGLLVIGTPNTATLRNRLLALFGRSIYSSLEQYLDDNHRFEYKGFRRFTGHVREYTMSELNSLVMRNFGFNILHKRYFPSNLQAKSVQYYLYNFLEKIYPKFGYHMVIIGQKVASS